MKPTKRSQRAWASYLAELCTHGYPPKTRRRLRNVNVVCYTIAVSCALFALTYALEDPATYRNAIVINLAMLVAMMAAPALHRLHDAAAALYVAAVLMGGLFLIIEQVGRESGIQINFIGASALAFVMLGLRRMGYIAVVIAVAIALHVFAWVLFRQGAAPGPVADAFLMQLYVTTAVTLSIIVAVAVYYAFWTAERAEAETEDLLHRVLPHTVADRLKARPDALLSDNFDEAAILFSDLAGFVPIARSLGAARTVEMLNHLVHGFDRLAVKHGIEKIKTIGDAYMAAAIGPYPAAENAARLARMALDMPAATAETAAAFDVALRLRVGIAFGPVMAGIIGSQRFGYDLWGDPVNLAARLESSGEPGRIQVSEAFRDVLAERFRFEPRGPIEIKGVGRQDTWFLLGEAK